MSQRDGFSTGFIAGTIVGGVLGGAIGALLATQRSSEQAADPERRNTNLVGSNNRRSRRQFKATSEQSIEIARRSLEDKIAQLNETIDEVRLTLGQVNGDRVGNTERVPNREEDVTP